MKIPNETKVGILLVAAIVLLILGFNILKGNHLFSSTTDLYAVYENVNGLKPSDPVIVNGMGIGSVSSLKIMNKHAGKILVKFSINKDLNIPKNSIARITSADLLSGKAIKLDFGDSNDYLREGDTVSSNVTPSITQKLTNKLDPISNQIGTTLTSLDSVLEGVNATLDQQAQKELREGISSLNTTMQNAASATAQINELTKKLNSFVDNLNEQNEHINQIVGNAEKATASLAQADITTTMDELKTSVGNLNDILKKLDNGEGSLGELINNKKLYSNLESATANLNLLMEDLRINPKRYVHFSIFGGKNKTQPLPSDSTLN